MTKKLHIKTWGCQMNEYDSSKMADLLDATHGYQLTEVAEEADVLLLNTCSIREKAQEKVFHQLGRWKLLKEKNPDLIIGVGGCVASQEGDHIRQRAHYVDIIFGPQTLHRLPEMINSVRGNRSPVVDISFPEIEKFDRLPEPRAEGPTAFVSIMEGCNKYCTYCVVPYTRGEEVSRPCDDILFEIAQLAAQGVRRRHRRHRPHSLHHQPPDRIYRRYHRRLSRYAGAGELPAPAGAEWLRPCAEPDGTHPYRAGV